MWNSRSVSHKQHPLDQNSSHNYTRPVGNISSQTGWAIIRLSKPHTKPCTLCHRGTWSIPGSLPVFRWRSLGTRLVEVTHKFWTCKMFRIWDILIPWYLCSRMLLSIQLCQQQSASLLRNILLFSYVSRIFLRRNILLSCYFSSRSTFVGDIFHYLLTTVPEWFSSEK